MFNAGIDFALKAPVIIRAALLCSISNFLRCDFLWPLSPCGMYHTDAQ